jgi:hypothetical protein
MARDLPYLTSYKNVGKLFDGIFSAKQPDSFTHEFLRDTLGIKGGSAILTSLSSLAIVSAAVLAQ